jgi:dTDP-4-dehydrorhamnose reductase
VSAGPRILIVGATGQLGMELQRSFAGTNPMVAVDRELLNLAVPDQIRAVVRSVQPDLILNAAAHTAVDRAETDRDAAMAVNAEAPRILAEEAHRRGALLVHYSTDYVFDGSKAAAWTEEDPTGPLNVYGASKLAGEEAVQRVGGRYLIFRTSWVYSPHGKNFLLTMLRLGRERDSLTVVNDQIGAPTSSLELASATRAAVDGVLADRYGPAEDWAGLYHMTCSGSTSWYGFAEAIFARAGELLNGRRPKLTPILSDDYPTPARRPRNSVLANEKLHTRFGIRLRPWEAALDAAMASLHDGSGRRFVGGTEK